MGKRKSVEFQDHEFICVATLRVGSDRLRMEDGGRIIEEPDLLVSFKRLVDAMLAASRSKFRFGEICVIEGAYIVDVSCVPGLTDHGAEIAALFSKFKQDGDQLELNADRPEPLSASACGVSSSSLNVLEAALKLDSDHVVSVLLDDGSEIEMSAPSQSAMTALPPAEKKPKKVDGEITGMGRGDERGCRLEVANGDMFVVSRLTLEEAFEAVRLTQHITGVAAWDGDAYVLDDPVYVNGIGI